MDHQQNDDDGQHPSAVPSAIVTQTPVSEKEMKRQQKKAKKKEKKRRARELGVPYESEKKKKKKDKKEKSPLKDEEEANGEKIGSSSSSQQKEQKRGTSSTLNGIKQKQLSSIPPSATEIEKISSQKQQHQTPTMNNGSIFSLIATSTKSSSSSSTPNNSKHNNNKQSPYQIKTILGTVALLPTSLPNVTNHITNLLQTLLLMYDSNMGGVLLSLENDVTLLPVDYKAGSSSRDNNSGLLIGGRIVDDLPYIHYKFSVDVLLFCPILGMKLSGKVVECTPTYITLTTHHILSTKISSETLHSEGYYYNGMTMEWVRERVVTATGSAIAALKNDEEEEDEDDDRLGPSTSIYLDDNVEFIIERIHECGGYISLDGTRPSVSTLG